MGSSYAAFSEYVGHTWYEPAYPPSYGLNSTTTVLLGECLWHEITYKGRYVIKQRNQTKQINFKTKMEIFA